MVVGLRLTDFQKMASLQILSARHDEIHSESTSDLRDTASTEFIQDCHKLSFLCYAHEGAMACFSIRPLRYFKANGQPRCARTGVSKYEHSFSSFARMVLASPLQSNSANEVNISESTDGLTFIHLRTVSRDFVRKSTLSTSVPGDQAGFPACVSHRH
jgi:hypothetical protein